MRPVYLQRVMRLYLSTVFLAGAISASAANSEMRLSGLALHQETGRNIYLGGIFFDRHVPKPDDLVNASGPKIMEYRVVARRTSMRSLLGGILLQSELANGVPPDDSVTRFANDILAGVRGSLYAGDSFEILLSENDETIAFLNGHELARIDDGRVADYILVGWIGEQGPSTAFRASMISDEIDPTLLEIFQATEFSAQRAGEVASWLQPARRIEPAGSTDPGSAIASTTTDSQGDKAMDTQEPNDQEQAAELHASANEVHAAVSWAGEVHTADNIKGQGVMLISAGAIDTWERAANEPLIAQPRPRAVTEQADLDPAPAAAPAERTQLASLQPLSDLLGADQPPGVEDLDIQEYSQRLASFNTRLIRSVYEEINYPRQAVRRNLQGRLELDVTLREDGSLVDISVARSSGYKILDKAALKAASTALASIDPETMDPVAIAEYSDDSGELVVPVPVQFLLTE